MQYDVRKSLIRIVAGPIIVLGVMVGLSLLSIQVLTKLNGSVVAAQEIENAAQEILTSFLNMETGLRGYVGSHDPVFLEAYWQGRTELESALAKIRGLSKEDDFQQDAIDSIEALKTKWFEYAEGVRLEVSKSQPLASPPLALIQLEGKKQMDTIREVVNKIITRERQNYNVRAEKTKLSVRWANYSVLGLFILLGFLIIFYLRTEILRLSSEFNANLNETLESREKLRQANESLEAAVKERTKDLQVAVSELEAFCYSVSHDLRAPLRGIDGFSEALKEDYGSTLSPGALSYIAYIRQGVQRMGQLIDDLLTLSKLSRVEAVFEELDLGELANEVEEEVQRANPSRKVDYQGVDHAMVLGDKTLLRSVMTNLLSNAWKFTEKVPEPKISFGVSKKEGKNIFYVKDNGAGFDMVHSGKLFGAFQRLHSAKEFPGSGVGLASVRRILRRHGGDIWAEGELGKGATFFFTLGLEEGEIKHEV